LIRRRSAPTGQSLVSTSDWHRPSVRWGIGSAQRILLVALVIVGLGPILWLAKSAVTPTNDIISHPMGLFPHGAAWSNLREAWTDVHVGRYFWNTVVLAIGSWAVQIVVATTGGFALSVLRPRYWKLIYGLLLMTLFVPAVVLLVPLYIEIVKRFFDNLPREIFEAARIDGAGPFRLFWSVVLPMSKPILGVVSVFAILASWKDFLWPLLVLQNPETQTLSVALSRLSTTGRVPMDEFMAGLVIASIPMIAVFLVFQRHILAGLSAGSLKG
jgi:multiple sugar transport system permease protein